MQRALLLTPSHPVGLGSGIGERSHAQNRCLLSKSIIRLLRPNMHYIREHPVKNALEALSTPLY